VRQWCSTWPSENRSLRGSTTRPRACSGDMKVALPFTMPARVCDVRRFDLTMPKSDSFTLAGERNHDVARRDVAVDDAHGLAIFVEGSRARRRSASAVSWAM